jgi:enoyl-CoA hydratase/carnithine racemase
MSDAVRLEVSEYIAVVTLDSPPVNAQSVRLIEELTSAMDQISERPDVRVAILTGAGKVFSAGADMKDRQRVAMADGGQSGAHFRRSREAYHSVRECTKPVIGALNGPALGAGLAVAASCDILVASETACLGLPEIDVGLMGGGRHAMRLFGHSRVRRMMLTGYRVQGPELYRLGVVEACTPPDRLMDEALDIARVIAAKSPVAARLAKQSLNTIEEMSLRDGYRYEQMMTAQLTKLDDSKEAMRAFAEKRKPNFIST